jgi:hypothetical protein
VTNVGVGGQTSTYWVNNIAASIAAHPDNHRIVLYQIGVNEFGSITQAQWIANVEYVLDTMHARWPAAAMYLSKPWKCAPANGVCTADAIADQYAAWVDQVVSERSSFVNVGDDERAWFKPNYLAYSDDTGNLVGLHFYTPSGQARKTLETKTLLGY